MANVYLFSIFYGREGQAVARAGYFSLCAKETADSTTWLCSSSAPGLRAILGGVEVDNDPLNVIEMAGRFRSGVVFPGLLYARLTNPFDVTTPPG